MKIMMLVAAFAMTLMLSGCDGKVDTNSFPLQQPTAEYEIDTWGSNSEVYEFNLKTVPNKTCVMVMLDSGSAMGLQCFDNNASK